MKRLFLVLLFAARAFTQQPAASNATALTTYNQNFFLVREHLPLGLTAGGNHVDDAGVAARTLPGCEPAPEVRKILDEKIDHNKDLQKMTFNDRADFQHAVWEDLIVKYPREIEPYRRLIEDARWMHFPDPRQIPALRERFRKQAAQNPDDPMALYVAGLTLFQTDTPESLRLLDAAKAKAPQFPWPALALATEYESGKSVDKQKSSENLAVFFTACPDSTEGEAQWFLAKDVSLQPKVAGALRVGLARESDPARLKDYGTLWGLEFRSLPPQEHDALRKQVAEDVKRLESLNPKPDSKWLALLISGDKQADASSETITAMEDRLLREFPHSDEARYITLQRWDKANKRPEDQKDATAWSKYHEAFKEGLKGWMRDFPDDSYLVHEAWFYAISDQDSLTEKDGIPVLDEWLRYDTVHNWKSSWTQFGAADFLLKHKWQPSRAIQLLEQAKTESDRERAWRMTNDNLSVDERDQLNEQDFAWELRLDGLMLKAAQLAGRPAAAKAIKQSVEGPPPTQEKLLSDYWWNRARLAEVEGRKIDALAYYQSSLHTRLEAPQYREGRFRDDLVDEAQALWKETGGTPAAWAVWSTTPTSKAVELAQGRWEKPKKTLPAFELVDLSGKTWRLKDLRGKALLINIWASWCAPCRHELPKLQKLYEQLKDRSDVQVLSFDIDADLGLVAPFLKEKGYTFPVLPAYAFVENLQYDGIPETWIVDPRGNWLWTQIGDGGEDDWAQVMIQKLESAKTSN